MGDPVSHRISRVRQYSRSACTYLPLSSPTGLSPAPAVPSSDVRLTVVGEREVCWLLPCSRSTPIRQRQQPRTPYRFGLFPVRSPLLRESSLVLGVREMFQFPRFPPWQCQGHTFRCGVAPFGHRRITGCQPLPGAFRRVATSFIGSRRLGIHPMRICGVIAPARAGLPVPMGLLRDARGEPHLSGASPHPDPQGRSASILQGSRRITRNGWSRGDSNPGPPPCKGGALPAKLRPPIASGFLTPPLGVGAPGLEPGTSALSGPRSHHLSYAPVSACRASHTRGSCLAP